MSILIERFIAFFYENAPPSIRDDFWPIFVGVSLLAFIFSLMAWLVRAFSNRFESPKTRSIFNISLFLFIFIFVIGLEFINPGEASKLDSMPILILMTIGFSVYAIYGLLKGRNEFAFQSLTKDLNLKEGEKSEGGDDPVVCPYCHKKTISLVSAYYSAQSCGECGEKSLSLASELNSLIIAFSSFLLFCILGMKLANLVSTETTVWMILFAMILYVFVALTILWRVKVAVPFKPIYLFKLIRLY